VSIIDTLFSFYQRRLTCKNEHIFCTLCSCLCFSCLVGSAQKQTIQLTRVIVSASSKDIFLLLFSPRHVIIILFIDGHPKGRFFYIILQIETSFLFRYGTEVAFFYCSGHCDLHLSREGKF